MYFIQAWLQKFPFKQNLFVDYELFKNRPEEILNKIAAFLDIEAPPTLVPLWVYNKANTRDGIASLLRRKSVNLSQKFRSSVSSVLEPHVQRLYEIIEEDFHWKLDHLS